MSSEFEAWLDSTECFHLLQSCARQVSSRALRLGIPLDDAHLQDQSRDDYLSAVASDLWQFLKENAAKIAAQAADLLDATDDAGFMAFLCQKFLDHCLDERRAASPFHNYYRRMRSLLSETQEIRFEAYPRKGSYYAYSSRGDLNRLDMLSRVDYRAWSASGIPFRDIFERRAMLGLSHHFWDESLREFLQEYLIPVRELVRYVFASYPLALSVEYVDAQGDGGEEGCMSLEESLVEDSAYLSFDAAWKRQLPALEADIVDGQLETLARDCAAELTGQERVIIAGMDAGETLETLARLLGLKGASNVSYHQKKAFAKIRTKWSLWGPASPGNFSEVDEKEFFMFYEKVTGFCKTGQSFRDGSKRTNA